MSPFSVLIELTFSLDASMCFPITRPVTRSRVKTGLTGIKGEDT